MIQCGSSMKCRRTPNGIRPRPRLREVRRDLHASGHIPISAELRF
jgi:hypothetical protein